MSEQNGTAPRGFDADERAKAREAAPITVGEKVFHPVRLTNPAMREVRKYAREANRMLKEIERFDNLLDPEHPTYKADGLSEPEEERYDKLQDEVFDMTIKQLCVVLRDEAMRRPQEQHLADNLDYRDARDLTKYVMGGEDDEEDPSEKPTEMTPTTP